jgi:UDP-galactopyranose mutase
MIGKYDYLIVGSGLYGAVFAERANGAGKKCLVLEKRDHIAGNIYTQIQEDITVHRYGAHIFHTNKAEVWKYVRQFADFNHYINSPLANYKNEIYNLPFNMNTFNKMWGVVTPKEAQEEIERQRKTCYTEKPKNLEQAALNMVGRDIFEKLIRGYTEKQWGRPCSELPPSIIRRLPLRFIYDNNYFNAIYQGIPIGGYTAMIERMLKGIEVWLNADYLDNKKEYDKMAKKVIYTGPIDRFFDYTLGPLEYRSLRFDTQILDTENYQGNAVVNYTDRDAPFTRIIEHKHFEFGTQKKTVISHEYSVEWKQGGEAYYPIENNKNLDLYSRYRMMANTEENVLFGGRLGMYHYYDMDQTIEQALAYAANLK